MAELNRTSCCGVREYDGLTEFQSIKECLLDVYRRFYDLDEENDGWDSGAFILFTCPAYKRKIPRLVRYIEENNLGTCTVTPPRLNPNSDNNLLAMLFGVDHNAFSHWYDENEDSDVDEDDEDYWYEVGDTVVNVATGSARIGRKAEVTDIDDGVVWVRYEDGGTGRGYRTDYKLVD